MKQNPNVSQHFGLSDQFESFSQLLKTVRRNAGFSAKDIAAMTNVHPNSQGHYENKERDPSVDYLIQYACGVDIPFWQLMMRRVELAGIDERFKERVLSEAGPLFRHISEPQKQYSVVEKPDTPEQTLSQEHYSQMIEACEQLLARLKTHPGTRQFRQTGDSMAPTLRDGDTLFVDTNSRVMTDNDLFVFKVGNDLHSAKRIQYHPGGGVALISDNPQYQTVHKTNKEVPALENEIVGKVISAITQF